MSNYGLPEDGYFVDWEMGPGTFRVRNLGGGEFSLHSGPTRVGTLQEHDGLFDVQIDAGTFVRSESDLEYEEVLALFE